MKAAGKAHLLNTLLYPEAGHLIEPPFSPHCRASNFKKNSKMFFTPFLRGISNCSQSLWFISRYSCRSSVCARLQSVPAILMWGGATKPHSDAQEDAWTKILAYLQHHLYSSPTPKAKMWRRTQTLLDTDTFHCSTSCFCVLSVNTLHKETLTETNGSKLQMNKCSFYDLPQWEEPRLDLSTMRNLRWP